MAIIFNQEARVFTLQTKNTSYQMKAGDHDVLLHLYYGKTIGECDMSYLIPKADRGFSGNPYEAGEDRSFSLDVLPQEYSGFGTGDYRNASIWVTNADGSRAVDLRYLSHRIYDGKYALKGLPAVYANENDRAQTLEIYLEDPASGIQVTLLYGVMEELDIITRACIVKNGGSGKVQLERAMSVCLDFCHNHLDLLHFYGKHAMEREVERLPAGHGSHVTGSRRGASSHQHNPFLILCDPKAGEDFGDCYGISLLYSGNFIAETEVDQFSQTRITMGINPELFSYSLGKGESFVTPEAAMAYTDQGLGELSRLFHKAYRNNLCRGEYKKKRRPILINNWEATYFDFDGEKLVDIARASKELGIEMLVMDDGWFGCRRDDSRGLGDWSVNEEKLGCSLEHLAGQINQLGMKFGIWFEPEMVSEDSLLYRLHPDWALRIPGRAPNRSRYQLVLDFSREEVREHIYRAMCNILDSANIEYVKWDMNRSICDLYSPGLVPEKQGEISHRYVLGLYELLERLGERYPHILFEGCSGGGGRFDAGMLYYTPQIWLSDDTDAIERLKIQYGTSFGYPISAVGAHVSASPNHQTGRRTPLRTRGAVAMAGSFGYEMDLGKISGEEKEIIKEQIKEYKQYNELIFQGNYYRLTNPYENTVYFAWEFASPDGSQGLLTYVSTWLHGNPEPVILKPKGLNREAWYRVNGNGMYQGAALMSGGLLMEAPKEEYESHLYYITQIQ